MDHRFLNAFAVVLLVDQVSKFLVQSKVEIILNKGISFGLLGSNTLMLAVLLVITTSAVWYYCREFWKQYPLFSGLLFGGGVSNIIDRVFFGGVRDWLSIPGMNLKNNLADWAIFVAIIGILYLELAADREQQQGNHDSN